MKIVRAIPSWNRQILQSWWYPNQHGCNRLRRLLSSSYVFSSARFYQQMLQAVLREAFPKSILRPSHLFPLEALWITRYAQCLRVHSFLFYFSTAYRLRCSDELSVWSCVPTVLLEVDQRQHQVHFGWPRTIVYRQFQPYLSIAKR